MLLTLTFSRRSVKKSQFLTGLYHFPVIGAFDRGFQVV
jgi:hypothetical protein